MHVQQYLVGLALVGVVACKTTTTIDGKDYTCKCYKGDACWPSDTAWTQLNSTVEGRLYAVAPIGRPCFKTYDGQPTYNEVQCNETTTNNQVAAWVVKDSTQIMYEYYTNNTCDPGTSQQNQTCTQGYYPDYVIKAMSKEHIAAGVNFARENNVRLVIRNTGHDFMGRSIGRGCLTINTQSFQDITFIDKYTGPGDWTGGAVNVSAGVVFRDLYPLAFKRGVVVVGGECATVGMAGGYLQGGGHGPLSGYLGLAVDNALSFDVVLASGEFVQANANENQELFWALRGGGPSTFGVVTGVTLKTHPEVPSIAMTMAITGPDTTFWKGVYHFRSFQNTFSNAGLYIWYGITPGNILNIQPFVAPNFTRADFDKLVQPFISALNKDNVTFTSQIQDFKTFYELYNTTFEKTHDAGAQQSIMGGRIIVRDDISTPSQAQNLTSAIRTILSSGSIVAGHILNPGSLISAVKNSTTAAHPSWYRASSQDVFFLPVGSKLTAAERKAAEDKVTWDLGKILRDATPNSASYVNEGDVNEPNWQSTYWGGHYELLWKLKRILDPNGVFYAKTTPGTEDWMEFDGKLCKRAEN